MTTIVADAISIAIAEAEPVTPIVERTSWWPKARNGEAGDPKPSRLRLRGSDNCLLYAGRVNLFFGESEAGKTWAEVLAFAEALLDGESAILIDLEADRNEIDGRLLALGVPAEVVAEQFYYIAPEEPLDERGLADLDELIHTVRPAVVGIDAVAETMELHDLDPNSTSDYQEFMRLLPNRIAKQGPTVVLIDHNGHSAPGRPIGSQHKKAALGGTSLLFEMKETFGRGLHGKALLTVKKDRPGWLGQITGEKRRVAYFHLEANADGSEAHAWLEPYQSQTRDAATPDPALEEAISGVMSGLDRLKVPAKAGREAAREALTQAGIKVANDTLAEALRRRKAPKLSADSSDRSPGTDVGTAA